MFSFRRLNEVLWAYKDTRTEDAIFFLVEFERLAYDSSNGFVILCDSHQYSYLLFSVAYKPSCTVERINPEADIWFLDKMSVFFYGVMINKFVGIDFGEIHNFSFFSYFSADVVIGVSILLANDFQARILW